MIQNRGQFLKLGGAVAGAACFASCSDGRFQLRDVVVSDVDDTLMDPEFSQVGPFMAWVSRDRNLWVNDLDPADGTWKPRNGRQVHVDSSLARVGDTRQGIEWAHAHDGPRMVYTKEVGSEYGLHQARLVGGEWTTEALEGGTGLWLYQASRDEGDPSPRVIFRDERSPAQFGWREIDDPSTQEWLDEAHRHPLWLAGSRALVGLDERRQPFIYDLESRELSRVSSDESVRHRYPTAFRNESGCTVITVVDDALIGVYRKTGGSWSLVRTMRPDSDLPFVFHPKLWFHRGRPLITFMMTTEKHGKTQNRRGIAEVWVAAITDGEPFCRMVNDPSIQRIKDTEGVSLPGGFFVYYAQILPDRRRLIHRCHSGV